MAFAPSNIERVVDASVDTSGLVSLGSIAWEPLWLFFRADLNVDEIQDLTGLTVATGPTDTVIGLISRELLRSIRILDKIEEFSKEDQTAETLAAALEDGEIDAAFALGIPTVPAIADLLRCENIAYLSVDRAEAYQARYPGIAKIVVPEGVIDLGLNIPPDDLVLLSATTNVISMDRLYPGLVPRILRAIAEARDQQQFTIDDGNFPSPKNASLPIKRAATRFYDQGDEGLASRLPYGMVRWLNHLGFVVMPLLLIVILAIKVVPVALKLWSRITLQKILKRLEAVEKADAGGADPGELVEELDRIDADSATIFVPRSSVHDYVDIRQFLHDMRDRISDSIQ